jgi:hypothetical protein
MRLSLKSRILLELGVGFSFVGRQKRIQIDGEDFYIDLLFYNRKLKRLVVVELKQGAFRADYKGQMELYLRWLVKYERESGRSSAARPHPLRRGQVPGKLNSWSWTLLGYTSRST